MSIWARSKAYCAANAEDFDREPESVTVSLRHRPYFDKLSLKGRWMEERTLGGAVLNTTETMERPVRRTFTLTEGELYDDFLKQIRDVGRYISLQNGASVQGITLFPPSRGPRFVDWNGCRRLYVKLREPAAEQPVIQNVSNFVADELTDVDNDIGSKDVLRFESFFSDFDRREAISLNAEVLTERPERFHPNVDSVTEIAETVADSPTEQQAVEHADTYIEYFSGDSEDEEILPEAKAIAEDALDNAIERAITVDGSFVVEGEVVRGNVRTPPSSAYDIMKMNSYERVPINELETGFWLFLPPADQ